MHVAATRTAACRARSRASARARGGGGKPTRRGSKGKARSKPKGAAKKEEGYVSLKYKAYPYAQVPMWITVKVNIEGVLQPWTAATPGNCLLFRKSVNAAKRKAASVSGGGAAKRAHK
eukprot:COSAG04_NODE_6059_length_1420_cov_1.364875_1_plen_118_part_00